MVTPKREIVTNLMEQFPVVKLQPNSKDHARHAVEQALLEEHIDRQDYEELLGYVIHVMYKETDDKETTNN